MSNKKLWEKNERTEAKHHIIKEYLNAWLPIMASYEERIVYLDGFSGPGEYKGGEEGSPILAIKTALDHKYEKIKETEIVWLFSEKRKDRLEHLKDKINEIDLPEKWSYQCFNNTFEETTNEIFKVLDEQNSRLAPALIFIDPFGFTGFTMNQIEKYMENRKCEVIITFMYEAINRFLSHPNEKQKENFDKLFGSQEWRSITHIEGDPKKRNEKIRQLYKNQLESEANIEFVRSFELRRGNRPSYYLYFGTNNIRGLEKMTNAMWRVDPTGGYSISDKTFGQNVLFEPEPNWDKLKSIVQEELKDQTIKVDKLLNWVLVNTGFKTNGVKTNVLKPMEKNDLIEIVDSPRKRDLSYPDGTHIHIK